MKLQDCGAELGENHPVCSLYFKKAGEYFSKNANKDKKIQNYTTIVAISTLMLRLMRKNWKQLKHIKNCITFV